MTTIVKPITHDHITLCLDEDHRVVWFNLQNGGAELIVLDSGATEVTRLAVAPPEPGDKLTIKTPDRSTVEIIYEHLFMPT